ncbi:transcription elongation factor SPT5 [Pancytospora philotis]|nr:transcription elongation factor SPT5 [Pancytospora philotis]
MSRRALQYVKVEAESGSESEFDGSSEDMDNLQPALPRVKNYRDFTREMEEKYIVSEAEDEAEYGLESDNELEAPSQLRLLPTAHSPLLFLVRCKLGKEREIAARVLESARTAGPKGEPSGVYSVVQKDGLKGYLYLEAHKKQAVEDVLARVRNVGRSKLSVVPFREMVEALTYRKDQAVGDFARIKDGKYKGDLVQVLENDEDTVKVRAVPRIGNTKRLFDPEEYRSAVKREGGYMYNRDFYLDGYLIKTVLKRNLDFDAEPVFAELSELGLNSAMAVNDTIRVRRGDLQSVVGRVLSLCGQSVLIEDKETREKYELNIEDLEKHYEPGQLVSYNGVNGMVVGMDGRNVVVGMNDFTEEIKVPATALRAPVAQRKTTVESAAIPRMRRDPLVNKRVHITEGEYKGCAGVVKNVYKGRCRVFLELKHTCISIPVDSLSFEEARRAFHADSHAVPAGDFNSQGSQTPGYKTPGYTTPGYKTPGYTTPGYKTPGYTTPGYKTPGYQTPGYKTPGYQTPGYKTPGYTTPGYRPQASRPGYTEDAGTDWLTQQSVYDGTLVSVHGGTVTLSDVKGDTFVAKDGRTYARRDVAFVRPQRYENVIVLEGAHAGNEGALVTISGDSGTVKTANGSTYTVGINQVSKKLTDNKFI